ncbi:AAA family ATPase [Hymenobacter chitinivorans]|uniref:Putative ATPase n=1 Tax=Hymenobacter chitinivorans DSM 11115 TaxID=1121954 RepID=A0A2M9BQ54_9BACT|nr:AAA family ATPase [Hymenobacter chitinivorans]PJJ60047.1 putative ATPase [Hymenobacter chitinivorans DSM 11115]
MLKRLHVKNFTVFAEAEFEFSRGLNVIVGTNGTGKSHVLKLGYAVLNSFGSKHLLEDYQASNNSNDVSLPRKEETITIHEKLLTVFRPSPARLRQLIRREAVPQEARIEYDFHNQSYSPGVLSFQSNRSHESNIGLNSWENVVQWFAPPVFIPAKEVLTLGWMLSASRQFKLPMDETYLDVLGQLSGLALQNPEQAAAAAISALTKLLGGEVEEQNGSFFLVYPKEERMEMNLVAEGLRKFGTLQKLLSNGSLTPRATLFWDEPEANLNPALLKKLAALLVQLAGQGFQIILATHSLFLLKEFHILSRELKTPVRYFGLSAEPGQATTVTAADNLEHLPDIVALDAELEQSDKFLNVLNQEDADI